MGFFVRATADPRDIYSNGEHKILKICAICGKKT
jgi:hypothetical protein